MSEDLLLTAGQRAEGHQLPLSLLPNATNAHISGGTFNAAGRDVHNHYYNAPSSTSVLASPEARDIPRYRDILADALNKATEGTGEHVLESSLFRAWTGGGQCKMLWGTGIRAGKTTLASIVIDRLQRMAERSNERICVAYIFIRYSHPVSVPAIIEAFVSQLTGGRADVAKIVEAAYARYKTGRAALNERELQKILSAAIALFGARFLILDGLDETSAEKQYALLRLLSTLDVKLFITSRPLAKLEPKFPGATFFRVAAQERDIRLHVNERISRHPDLEDLLEDHDFREQVTVKIISNSDGMFLHAALQLEALCECLSVQDALETLERFPPNIEDAYYQTWKRIEAQPSSFVALAKRVLLWVLHAQEELTINALRRAVATSPETHAFEHKRVVSDAALLSVCCGLVKLDEKSRLVRLIHYTVKDALEPLLLSSFPHPHSELAVVCITHLTTYGLQDSAARTDCELRDALASDPVLCYAFRNWAFHARKSRHLPIIRSKIVQFIGSCTSYPRTADSTWDATSDRLGPLHVAAYYGFADCLQLLLESRDPNERTNQGVSVTPLTLACRGSHPTCVRVLLAAPSIQVNSIDSTGATALGWASRTGNDEIVRLFLEHRDVDVNAGWPQSSPLVQAVQRGHHSTVHLFLESGLAISTAVIEKALPIACHMDEAIARLLISCPGIKVDWASSHGFNALTIASSGCRETIVQLLLEKPGIETNKSTYHDGRTPLIIAAGWGFERIVQLLLLHPEIDPNVQDHVGWTALMKAVNVSAIDVAIVALLLHHTSINVNLQNHDGSTALMLAVRKRHTTAIQRLLQHSQIDVNLTSKHGWTALALACWVGYGEVVRMLLEMPDIDTRIPTDKKKTPMALALERRHQTIVQMLKDHESKPVSDEGGSEWGDSQFEDALDFLD